MKLNSDECLRRGAVGALGAVPGTIAAHPCDLVKLNQQVTGASIGAAVGGIRSRATGTGIGAFYHGVGAGAMQKVLTRGPMFLVSEVCRRM